MPKKPQMNADWFFATDKESLSVLCFPELLNIAEGRQIV